uniref:Uncharacterized protein n=1 Tax=Babesia bovis TaxID=5865 RepID=S6B0M1_BABBO|nr:hypothetical protein [Babesia bovis]
MRVVRITHHSIMNNTTYAFTWHKRFFLEHPYGDHRHTLYVPNKTTKQNSSGITKTHLAAPYQQAI